MESQYVTIAEYDDAMELFSARYLATGLADCSDPSICIELNPGLSEICEIITGTCGFKVDQITVVDLTENAASNMVYNQKCVFMYKGVGTVTVTSDEVENPFTLANEQLKLINHPFSGEFFTSMDEESSGYLYVFSHVHSKPTHSDLDLIKKEISENKIEAGNRIHFGVTTVTRLLDVSVAEAMYYANLVDIVFMDYSGDMLCDIANRYMPNTQFLDAQRTFILSMTMDEISLVRFYTEDGAQMIGDFTGDDEEVIASYTTEALSSISPYIQNRIADLSLANESPEDVMDGVIDSLEDLILRAPPLGDDVIVYFGTLDDSVSLPSNTEISKGFICVTTDIGVALNDIEDATEEETRRIFCIKLPAGTHILNISPHRSHGMSERFEYLLTPGTSFQVIETKEQDIVFLDRRDLETDEHGTIEPDELQANLVEKVKVVKAVAML